MPSAAEQSGRRTILVVDDDDLLREVLARALRDAGYGVLLAADGEEALVLASTLSGQLSLVVTDIQMPVMDGVELAGRLAGLTPRPPVLFISGSAPVAGDLPAPVLPKPFTPEALLIEVGRLVNPNPVPSALTE